MRRFLLGCLLAAPLSVAVAGQDKSDESWTLLEKAARAAHELSYKGIFVYQSGPNTKSVQITHMNYGQGEYARIVMLDGSPREVLSQGNDVVIYSPRHEKVVIEKRHGQNLFPALLPTNLDAIKTSYQVRLGGIERVGGREGQVVFLDPRDRYRYGYKFWTDRENGLLLKAMTTNERNDTLDQISFNQLTLMNTQAMDWFQPTVEHDKPYVMEEQQARLATTAISDEWILAQLPPGFRKVDQVKRMVPGKSMPVNQLMFCDGLASVSLFIEQLSKDAHGKTGRSSQGPTNFYSNVVDGYQIVVVGEVPEATISLIANAVSFKK